MATKSYSNRRNSVAEIPKWVELCRQKDDPDGFKKVYMDNVIGYGIFAERDISENDFLLEYKGEIISQVHAEQRHEKYMKLGKGCFIFDLTFHGKKVSIDATKSTNLARFVNDSPERFANCRIKLFELDGTPHLFLIAKKFISAGTELRYDYKDRSNLQWRVKESYLKPFTLEEVKETLYGRPLRKKEFLNASSVFESLNLKENLPVTEASYLSNTDESLLNEIVPFKRSPCLYENEWDPIDFTRWDSKLDNMNASLLNDATTSQVSQYDTKPSNMIAPLFNEAYTCQVSQCGTNPSNMNASFFNGATTAQVSQCCTKPTNMIAPLFNEAYTCQVAQCDTKPTNMIAPLFSEAYTCQVAQCGTNPSNIVAPLFNGATTDQVSQCDTKPTNMIAPLFSEAYTCQVAQYDTKPSNMIAPLFYDGFVYQVSQCDTVNVPLVFKDVPQIVSSEV